MVVDALVSKFTLFRPDKETSTKGKQSFTSTTLYGVKLNQPASAWITNTSGAVQSKSATLYFNYGKSTQSPALSPLFLAGDIICEGTPSTPPTDRFVVSSVTEHSFKGIKHHIEVVLA